MDIRENEVCTREQFMNMFDRSHFADKAVKVLDDHGVFPLSYTNPMLQYINLLGLYTYSSGTIRRDENRFSAEISTTGIEWDIASDLEEKLGLEFNARSRGRLNFSTNGSSYGRLLFLMGFPISDANDSSLSNKAQMGTRLPGYLSHLIEEYENLTVRDQQVCIKYIRDFVKVWFDAKGAVHSDHDLSLTLMTQPTEELVQVQGTHLIKSLNILYPDIGFSDSQVNITERKENSYGGNVAISPEQVIQFPYQSSPVSFQVVINPPRLSIHHPRSGIRDKRDCP